MKQRKNLDVILYENIRESFLYGIFHLGDKIDIDQIAEKYNVSRTPVVQALRRLEFEGMLTTGPTGKLMVPEFSANDIKEIYEVRTLIEQFAVRKISSSDITLDLTQLNQKEQDCEKGYNEGNVFATSKADMDFHRELVKLAGNTCLLDFYDAVQGQCFVVNYLLYSNFQVFYKRFKTEHKDIINSIEDYENEQTLFLVTHHLDHIKEEIIGLLPEKLVKGNAKILNKSIVSLIPVFL